MRKWLPWVILAAVIVAALTLWLIVSNRPVAVETAKVETGPATELVYATGFVEPARPVTVSSRITAPVVAVLVEEGSRVVAGQPLVRLDDAEQRGLLAQAQAEARAAILAERRVTTLYVQGWVTRAARDEAVARSQAAQASVTALNARRDQMTVRAGISGIVLKRDVYPGDLATTGKELMQLGDPGSARITATVDERDIPRVRVGQQALMSSDAMPGRVVRGRVTEITPGGDPNQRAFRVRIGFEGEADLPFGLTLEVNIVTRRRDKTLLAPAPAIDDGKVWVIDEGKAHFRKVTTGITGTDKIEILSGLKAGDSVIVNPPEGLEDGDKVRP
ncbi:MAG: efflux RND transporter periplasmic adaptor subunit [Novosphingobium sp.]|nr:efflux RND transporter periplasmic adaptor subunit [Novosphingobium sp.]